MDERGATALRACADYEHWASDISRLTGEIANTVCPQEREQEWTEEGGLVEAVSSCFRRAKEDRANWSPEGPEDPAYPPSLRTIEVLVSGCVACLRLCQLIRERKHARQRYGVAKRRIRSVGKTALASLPTDSEGTD